jgi:hypothetical protein
MRIYKEKRSDTILFEFTERKFENKISSFLFHAKKHIKKFYKRKNKVSGVYIIYTYGYLTKEPEQYTRFEAIPKDFPLISEVVDFTAVNIQEKYNYVLKKYDTGKGNIIFYIRSIELHFLYT